MTEVKTVRMARSKPARKGAPTTADVHPDEVAGYEDGGWHVVPEAPKASEKK